MQKVLEIFNKHKELFVVLGLFILCYFIFFFNIGNYPLMDVDETRYVSMARDMFHSKDFLTLYLNGDYFFEKPPLYFWGECLSFAIFGKVNEFTARFPVALYGALCTFLVYFVGKKFVSRRYGFISALILATSLEFVMLAKFAILDIVVTTCVGFSVMFGFLTQFENNNEKVKTLYWWLFYIFSGLAVMAKGIPGFVVPFATMFFVSIYNKTFKQIFRPQYIFPGFLFFFLIIIPWHLAMFNIHNPLFYNEYVVKHHLERFLNSNEIGRKQPFYFYFVTVMWGLVPWIFSAISVGIVKMSKSIKERNFDFPKNRFLIFNAIAFGVVMLFFSSSSTKLITYILPVYFFTACIMGFVWEGYIFENKYKKAIDLTVYIFGGICILASFVACFMKFFLPEQLYLDLLSAKWFCIILIGLFGICSILCTKKNWAKGVFASYVIFMLMISAFGTKLFYNIDYKFGQNDLLEYAKYARENNNRIAVINNGRKYSLLYYYGATDEKKIYYISLDDEDQMKEFGEFVYEPDVVSVIRNKQYDEVREKYDFDVISKGRKFSLVKVK